MSAMLGSDAAPGLTIGHSHTLKRLSESSPDSEYNPDGISPPPAKRLTRTKSSRKNWNQAEEKLLIDMKSAGENWPTVVEQLWLQCGTVRGSEGCRTHFNALNRKTAMHRDNNDEDQNHHQDQSPHTLIGREEEEKFGPMEVNGFQGQNHAYQLVDELLHHGDMLQHVQDVPHPRPILGAETKVNHALLERAAAQVAAALPDTPKFYYIVAAVARATNHAQTPEQEAELMAQAGTDLKRGANRSIFLAMEYKKLSGQSIHPKVLEDAMKATESARSGESEGWVDFCMWVHQDNLPFAEIEAERMMDRKPRRAKRLADIAAGKFTWLCVAEVYDDLLGKHNDGVTHGMSGK